MFKNKYQLNTKSLMHYFMFNGKTNSKEEIKAKLESIKAIIKEAGLNHYQCIRAESFREESANCTQQKVVSLIGNRADINEMLNSGLELNNTILSFISTSDSETTIRRFLGYRQKKADLRKMVLGDKYASKNIGTIAHEDTIQFFIDELKIGLTPTNEQRSLRFYDADDKRWLNTNSHVSSVSGQLEYGSNNKILISVDINIPGFKDKEFAPQILSADTISIHNMPLKSGFSPLHKLQFTVDGIPREISESKSQVLTLSRKQNIQIKLPN